MSINRMSTRRGEDLLFFFLGPMYIPMLLTGYWDIGYWLFQFDQVKLGQGLEVFDQELHVALASL